MKTIISRLTTALAGTVVLVSVANGADVSKPATPVVVEKQPLAVKVVTESDEPVTASNPLDVRIAGIVPKTPPGFMLPVSIANVGMSSMPVHVGAQAWEHRYVIVDFSVGAGASAQKDLQSAWVHVDALGKQGWEIATTMPLPLHGGTSVAIIMKKPLVPASQ